MTLRALCLTGLAALTLAGTPLRATDFFPLLDVVRTTWPEKTHLAVVGDYRHSREEILALARAAGAGCTLTVMDVRLADQLPLAGTRLANEVKPQYVVLLPKDRLVRDGSPEATALAHQVARAGIPTIATTPLSLDYGVLFAMGEATGLKTLVTEKMVGTVGVTLPKKGDYLNPTAKLDLGSADLVVISKL